ncbi:unnamed protein product, partial [Brassica oleracea var. botrytis]
MTFFSPPTFRSTSASSSHGELLPPLPPPPPPHTQLTPWHSRALELLSPTTVAASSSLRSLFRPQPPQSVTLPPL